MSRRPMERTDGRRKGYQAHRSNIGDNLDAATYQRLMAMRGPVRKPRAERPHHKPEGGA